VDEIKSLCVITLDIAIPSRLDIHTVIVVVVMVIIIIVVVMVMVIVVGVGPVVAPVGLILGNAGRAERDLGFSLLPIADALDLSRIIVVSGITALGDTDDIAADIPAAVGNIVVVQLRGNSDVAGKHETTESEELLSTHSC
jgi:hypothetical protein